MSVASAASVMNAPSSEPAPPLGWNTVPFVGAVCEPFRKPLPSHGTYSKVPRSVTPDGTSIALSRR